MLKHVLVISAVALLTALVAVAQPPPEASERHERGLALKRAGKLQQSATELNAAIKAYPRYVEAHYALAWVQRAQGANDKAIESFREVIRIAPHSAEAVESARAIERIRLGPGLVAGRPRERIAFASTREGNTDIYVMELEGGALARLTSHPAVDDAPAWSRDGRRLAFVSERDGNREIYTVNLDGSNLQRLTDHIAIDDRPAWSPDGRLIAFESNRGGSVDVYVIGVDGTGLRQITNLPSDERLGGWSPDGNRLAVLSNRDGYDKVYLASAEGSGWSRLTGGNVPEGRPRWAPDGVHVFLTWSFERNAQVCRVSLDGRSLANITRSPYHDRLSDVSPDGRRVLVVSDRDGHDELYLVEVASGAARRLTFNPGPDFDGAFAPL